MVVLDGHNMLGTGPNQYLQPDYLSPLPTTLDAKKSPLALLAQTCSQIGADTPSTKSLLPSLHGSSDSSKRKSSCSSETSSNSHGSDSNSQREGSSRPKSNNGGVKSISSSSTSGGKSSPSFKPYESSSSGSSKPPTSHSSKNDEEKPRTPKSSTSTPPMSENKSSRTTSPAGAASTGAGRSSVSNGSNPPSAVSPSKPEPTRDTKSGSGETGKVSPGNSSKDQGASPIIRSGLEVLHGHMGSAKDLRDFGKPGLAGLGALGYPPGFDPTNPALRPPFFSSASHHAAVAAAAAFMGYPPATGAAGSPYVGYTRVKTPSGAETIVPVCKDPYCTGCQLGMPPGLMAAAAAAGGLGPYPPGVGPAVCPAGCVQCDHQKFTIGLPFMPPPGLSGIPTSTAAALASYSSSLLSQHQQAAAAAAAQQQQHQQQHQQAAAAAAAAQRPYVCNWIVGESYCGKRFLSSEELLQHLRTHTNLSTSEAQSLANPSSLYSNALLNSAAAAALHRTYPTPPLSPLSAARYHPYASGKPLSSLVPPHPPSLASYYPSPYSALYGQRIGPPVHP